MRGKIPVDKLLFDPEISKTERKNKKNKKQRAKRLSGESSSNNSIATKESTQTTNMVDEGESTAQPKRTLGDYA